MKHISVDDFDQLRAMASQLGCFLEEDFRMLANATSGTIEAWRKRGQGPAYILLGKRYLYPKQAVEIHLESLIRSRTPTQAARKNI